MIEPEVIVLVLALLLAGVTAIVPSLEGRTKALLIMLALFAGILVALRHQGAL